MQSRAFEINLQSPVRRIGLLLVLTVAVLASCYRVLQVASAEQQLESKDLAKVERAIAIDPENPALHQWAGLLMFYRPDTDRSLALAQLRRATELNSRVASYWLSLGMACFADAQSDCADSAYERAAATAPMKPVVLNEVGMYFLAAGNSERALLYFRRLIELAPDTSDAVFRACLRTLSPEVIWKTLRALSNPDSKLKFIAVLTESAQGDVAERYWAETVASHGALSLESVKPYLRQLEGRGDYTHMAGVWRDLEGTGKALPARPAGELVVNGGFEQELSNLGLDWHIRPEQFLKMKRVPDGSGNVLEFNFSVPHNTEHQPVFQVVPVVPGTTYEVSARVRSEAVTSDSGPRLSVHDAECPNCLNQTSEGTNGTSEWHAVKMRFTATSSTHFVRLTIGRPRSRSFPADISGQFWIDDVSMHPLEEHIQ